MSGFLINAMDLYLFFWLDELVLLRCSTLYVHIHDVPRRYVRNTRKICSAIRILQIAAPMPKNKMKHDKTLGFPQD